MSTPYLEVVYRDPWESSIERLRIPGTPFSRSHPPIIRVIAPFAAVPSQRTRVGRQARAAANVTAVATLIQTRVSI